MKKLLIVCFVTTSFYGFAAAANAAPTQGTSQPINVSATTPPQNGDMPYMLAKLQNEIQVLQTEVQTLGNLEGQAPGDSRYIFDAEPPPNPDGAPIPSGG